MRVTSSSFKWAMLLLVCYLTVLMLGCHTDRNSQGAEQSASVSTTVITAITTITLQTVLPTATLAIESPTAYAPSTPSPSPTVSAPTPAASLIPTPHIATPTTLATEIAVQANVDFDPVLAFMGMTAEEQFDEVAFYDTAGRVLTVVAQGIENEVFNAPLWSPEGDLLAFIQSDTAIGIYRPSDHVLELLGTAPIIPSNDLNSKVGVLLGGWSYDGNWLAYQYAYDVFEGDNYLLNRHTGQSYPLSFPASLVWMEWSPHSTQLAGYTNESIYIAEAPTASDIGNVEVDAQYQRADHSIYRIAWHPDEDGLLVSTSNVHVLEPFNFLWYLDLESGEWTDMGKYPSIVAMTYSPDLTDIAISTTNYATHENELIIIDAEGFKTTTQIELPIGPLFDHIRWITNETLALHGDENLYVLPVREPEEAYWVLDLDNNPLLEAYSRVIIRDWR